MKRLAWVLFSLLYPALLAAAPTIASSIALSPYPHGPAAALEAGESPMKHARLLFLGGGNPGSLRLGFDIELETGWHLYWVDPGDAGLAPSARWTLPKGFSPGPLLHPVPEKSVSDGLVSLTHSGRVLLLCDVTPPPSGMPQGHWEAAAVLEWMACSDICVVGETPVRAAFPPGPGPAEEGRALLAQFASRFPRPFSESGLELIPGPTEWTGSSWRVEATVAGPRAAAASDFFVYPIEGFVVDHAGVSCRAGKIAVSLVPSGGPGSAPPAAVRGIVLVDGTGYDVSFRVARRASSILGGAAGRPIFLLTKIHLSRMREGRT